MPSAEHDSQETEDLLEQAAAGDAQAGDRLLQRHRPRLREFVEVHLEPALRARLDASDVVQEAQMEAARRLPDFLRRRPMPFRLWLRKTAYERLLMLRRRHRGAARRATGREVQLPDRSSLALAERLLAPNSSPSRRADREEQAGRVRQALARLTATEREVLLMRHYEDLSYEEIGCILGVEAAAVRKRAGRALVRLHKALSALEGGSEGT
jgi:RNA polymerase sigma-70 factor (ECF subfamily)